MNAPERIQTERLVLRSYKLSDASEVFDSYAQDIEVTKYLTWRPHHSIEQTKAFVRDRVEAWEKGNDFTWAITLNDNALIGGIGLQVKDFSANFGYVISKPHWNNGYATEALKSIVQWALTQSRIFRIWAVCDVENKASARVMEKAGLIKEGLLKKYIIHPQISEIPRDCFCYSITR